MYWRHESRGPDVTTSVIENYPGFEIIDGPALAQAMEEQVRKRMSRSCESMLPG